MSSPEHKKLLRQTTPGERVVGDSGEVQNKKRVEQQLSKRIKKDLLKLDSLRTLLGTFDLKVAAEYLVLHSRIYSHSAHPLSQLTFPQSSQFDQLYWQVPYNPAAGKVLVTQITPQLEIWAGRLEIFPLELRAQMVDMALQIYASELVKTAQRATKEINTLHPRWGDKHKSAAIEKRTQLLNAQLLLLMMTTFRREYLLALAFATPDGSDGPRHLVGSIGATRGVLDQPFEQSAGSAGQSSIPTNTLVTYERTSGAEWLWSLPETSLVEITRLNVAWKKYLSMYGILRADVSQALMYIIHQVVAINFPTVVAEIFSTQPELLRSIAMLGLPNEVISLPGTVQPTAEVMASIHGEYFSTLPPAVQAMNVPQAVSVSERYYHLEEARL